MKKIIFVIIFILILPLIMGNNIPQLSSNTEKTYHFNARVTKQTSEINSNINRFYIIESHHSISAYNESQAVQELYIMFERWGIIENSYSNINSINRYIINVISLEGITDNNEASI